MERMGKQLQMLVFRSVVNEVADPHPSEIELLAENQTNTMFTDERLEITHLPGSSGRAIVSFAGIGMGFGGIQIEEFRRSLAGTSNDLLFVKDKSRTWFNDTFKKVGEMLNDTLRRLPIHDTVTIGNSMGGFAAIAFAAELPHCSRVIAFAAQSAVDPDVVAWEHRFDRWLAPVNEWTGLDAAKLLDNRIEYWLFFGDGDTNDIRHAMRFAANHSPGMSICVIEGCGHDVAVFLKRHNLLQPLLDELIIRDDPCRSITALRPVPHRLLVHSD